LPWPGQEEIDRIVAGGNYGWDCFEGILDFEMDAGCVAGPIRPEVVHDHPSFGSITGGYVYRGTAIPALQGAYVYGDFVSGEVCAYFFDETPTRLVSLSPPAGLSISSFGEDRTGELYVIDHSGSPSIYRIVPTP
jgi:glucose/arabinose dehydrogenase